jgi:hypothetical protein
MPVVSACQGSQPVMQPLLDSGTTQWTSVPSYRSVRVARAPREQWRNLGVYSLLWQHLGISIQRPSLTPALIGSCGVCRWHSVQEAPRRTAGQRAAARSGFIPPYLKAMEDGGQAAGGASGLLQAAPKAAPDGACARYHALSVPIHWFHCAHKVAACFETFEGCVDLMPQCTLGGWLNAETWAVHMSVRRELLTAFCCCDVIWYDERGYYAPVFLDSDL